MHCELWGLQPHRVLWMSKTPKVRRPFSSKNHSCKKSHCERCFDGQDNDVQVCIKCHKSRCSGCRFSYCSEDWKKACTDCLHIIGINPSIVPKLHKEKDELCLRIGKLEGLVRAMYVKGCVVSAINGTYSRIGYYRGFPKFSRTTFYNDKHVTFMLFWCIVKYNGRWVKEILTRSALLNNCCMQL